MDFMKFDFKGCGGDWKADKSTFDEAERLIVSSHTGIIARFNVNDFKSNEACETTINCMAQSKEMAEVLLGIYVNQQKLSNKYGQYALQSDEFRAGLRDVLSVALNVSSKELQLWVEEKANEE